MWTGRPGGLHCPHWYPMTTSLQPLPFRQRPGSSALVAGPALGGILIAAFGLGAVYGIDVATYGCAIAAVLLLPGLVPSLGGQRASLKSVAEGFRYLRTQRLLSASYWVDLNAMIFGMPLLVFPALGTGLFGGGAGVVGLLYAAPGAGALLGSFFTGWCVRWRNQGRAICGCVIIWGAAIALFRGHSHFVDRFDVVGARWSCRLDLRHFSAIRATAQSA